MHTINNLMMTKIFIIVIIIIMQDKTGFSGRQKQTSAMKLGQKVIVDIQFDALYRYVIIKSLQKLG